MGGEAWRTNAGRNCIPKPWVDGPAMVLLCGDVHVFIFLEMGALKRPLKLRGCYLCGGCDGGRKRGGCATVQLYGTEQKHSVRSMVGNVRAVAEGRVPGRCQGLPT